MKQILVGVQELLDNPNNADAAQDAAYRLYKRSSTDYAARVRLEAAKYTEQAPPPTVTAAANNGNDDDVVIL